MKSISALLVLFQFIGAQGVTLALSQSADASEFTCQEIYQRKLKRIYEQKTRRNIAEIAGAVALDAAVIASVYRLTKGMENGAGDDLTIATGVFSSALMYPIAAAFDRADRIESSYAVQKSMFIPYQVIFDKECIRRKETFFETFSRMDESNKRLKILQWTMERIEKGLPPLNDEETIQYAGGNECTKINIQNEIEALRKFTNFSTYEELRLFLVKNQDVFCPDGRALTPKQVAKNIKVRKFMN